MLYYTILVAAAKTSKFTAYVVRGVVAELFEGISSSGFSWQTQKYSQKVNDSTQGIAKPAANAMSASEALQVMQLEAVFTPQELEEVSHMQRFEKLMKLNDTAKGGSFYLQCKVTGAKEALLLELKARTQSSSTGEKKSP